MIAILLVAITLIAYWQVFGHDFIRFFDDDVYVVNNAVVQQGLTKAGLVWAFTQFHIANWHPLTWVSHMLDCQFYGMNPMGHHLTNLLFHIANVLLLFWALVLMTKSLWKSAFVAALFAVHPLHVESVAWVAERKDVLSTFFWLLAMLAYVWYVRRPNVGKYLLVALALALGLMSKPMLVTLPIVLLLMDYWPLGRLKPRQHSTLNTQRSTLSSLILEKAPLFALCVASSAITFFAQRAMGAVAMMTQFPLGVRISNALVAYASYIVKMVWPSGLAFYYPRAGNPIPAWQVAGAVVLLAAISFLVIKLARRHPYLPVGWLWYVVTLVPVIGFIQVGSHAMADRYTYVPLIGLFVIIAWGAPDLLARKMEPTKGKSRPRQVQSEPSNAAPLAAVAVAVVAVLMARTWIEVGYWRDAATLYTRALKCTSNNAMAHNNLGNVLFADGRIEEAAGHFREALRIDPSMSEASNNLANCLLQTGKPEEAIALYNEALRVMPNNAEAHYNLGTALARLDRLDEAIEHYAEALRIKPDYAVVHNNWGNALARQGKFDVAIGHYKEGLRMQPNLASAYGNMGNALGAQGKSAEAIANYNEALRIDPKLVEARVNLAITLSKLKRTNEAISQYREVVRIQPNHALAHHNLAALLCSKGDYAEAWKELRLAQQYGMAPDPALVGILSERVPGR